MWNKPQNYVIAYEIYRIRFVDFGTVDLTENSNCKKNNRSMSL